MDDRKRWVIIGGFVAGIFLVVVLLAIVIMNIFEQTAERIMLPFDQADQQLTKISDILNPTPTIIPDPITIIHDVRSLSRLETIQYSVEKVITAETGQGELSFFFGDRLLFVAHGIVIAGVDLNNLESQDIWIDGDVLYLRMPAPEVFITTLDNQKSYVYDRETGILTHGDMNLETNARRIAEEEILQAAINDGILEQAKENAEGFMTHLLMNMGYKEVVFTYHEQNNE